MLNDEDFVALIKPAHYRKHGLSIMTLLPSDNVGTIADRFAEETGVVNLVILSLEQCFDVVAHLHAGFVIWDENDYTSNPNLVGVVRDAEVELISDQCPVGLFVELLNDNGPGIRYVVMHETGDRT
jgi:hypothetical protein